MARPKTRTDTEWHGTVVTKAGKTYTDSLPNAMPCTDHLGNAYPSRQSMAHAYGMELCTLIARLGRDWPLEKALTTPVKPRSKPVTDHLGQAHASIRDLCREHHVDAGTFTGKLKKGASVEEALTKKRNAGPIACTDHLGKPYSSLTEMCKHWDITTNAFKQRREKGWTLEKTLTTPVTRHHHPKTGTVTGLKGETYKSVPAMCKAYGISLQTYKSRIKTGWSKADALTKPSNGSVECVDHSGRIHESTCAMCRYLGIPEHRGDGDRIRNNPAALGITCSNAWKGKDCGPYRNIYPVEFPWFQADMGEYPIIVHFDRILEEYHKNDPSAII